MSSTGLASEAGSNLGLGTELVQGPDSTVEAPAGVRSSGQDAGEDRRRVRDADGSSW